MTGVGPDVRVCFFGDSFTVGVGDRTGAGWVGPVAVAAREAGHDLTVYPMGVRRDTSVDIGRRWLAEARWRLKDGDRSGLVLACGLNDVVEHRGRPRVGLGRSLAAVADVLDTAHEASWPVLVVGPPPVADAGETERAARLALGMSQLCADRDVPFVDLTAPLAADPIWRAELAAGDRYHPSTAGYGRLAAVVAPAFLQWTAELAAAPAPSLRPERVPRPT